MLAIVNFYGKHTKLENLYLKIDKVGTKCPVVDNHNHTCHICLRRLRFKLYLTKSPHFTTNLANFSSNMGKC